MKYLLLLFSIVTLAQSQQIIPIDDETLEFISEVNFKLYENKNIVFSNITSKDSITRLPANVAFDSILFSKLNYQETGYKKENLTVVIKLKKLIYELDEIIIPNSKPKEIILGEQSRFVKRRSQTLQSNPDYGLLFREYDLKNKLIKRLTFFVEKVKYKTTYKIKFYAADEIGNFMTNQTLELKELLFESPILTLEKGIKNKVEVSLEECNLNTTNQNVFVCVELQAYYDENNTAIQPLVGDQTRLKSQLSKLINFYTKLVDGDTGELTKEMINSNAMINRDFAFNFFKKPHKSNLVAPAIILYATQIIK